MFKMLASINPTYYHFQEMSFAKEMVINAVISKYIPSNLLSAIALSAALNPTSLTCSAYSVSV